MATLNDDGITCEGSGQPADGIRRFGRGYWPDYRARCPQCGKGVHAEMVTGDHGIYSGVAESHSPVPGVGPKKYGQMLRAAKEARERTAPVGGIW